MRVRDGPRTRAYEQLGKMFMLKPLPALKKSLADSVEACKKDCAALQSKREHHEEVRAACRVT